MKEINEKNEEIQTKKLLKKYSIHQKVNTKSLGIELFNQNIATPYKAYLTCKLVLKEDIYSLTDVELIANATRIQWGSKKENQELYIRKINIFTFHEYIVLTFSLGFFQKNQAKYLPLLKNLVKELVGNCSKEVVQKVAADEAEKNFYDILEKFEQIGTLVERLEKRLEKNESAILESSKKIQQETTRINRTIERRMDRAELALKEVQVYSSTKEDVTQKQALTAIEPEVEPVKKLLLAKEISSETRIPEENQRLYIWNKDDFFQVKNWSSIHEKLQQAKRRKSKIIKPKFEVEANISTLELERQIVHFFKATDKMDKKRLIPKKTFLEWRAKVEYIDYLWITFKLEKKDELIIAQELSCKELIDELNPFLDVIEEVADAPKIFNYWVYCSQGVLTKLEGYVALGKLLDMSIGETSNAFMVS